MKKLNRFVKKLLKALGYVIVEHYLYWEEYASKAGRSSLTVKAHIITEIEIFGKETPKKVIEAYNRAFARQKLTIYDLYMCRSVKWTWKLIE